MKTETRYIMNNWLDVTFFIVNKVTPSFYNPRFDVIRVVEWPVCQ